MSFALQARAARQQRAEGWPTEDEELEESSEEEGEGEEGEGGGGEIGEMTDEERHRLRGEFERLMREGFLASGAPGCVGSIEI